MSGRCSTPDFRPTPIAASMFHSTSNTDEVINRERYEPSQAVNVNTDEVINRERYEPSQAVTPPNTLSPATAGREDIFTRRLRHGRPGKPES